MTDEIEQVARVITKERWMIAKDLFGDSPPTDEEKNIRLAKTAYNKTIDILMEKSNKKADELAKLPEHDEYEFLFMIEWLEQQKID